MKNLFFVTLLAVIPFMKGRAQEPYFYQEHPHSVTISTGLPCFLPMMYPPGSGDNSLTMQGWHTGSGYKTHMFYNFTLGYNYQASKRWEVAALFTVAGYIYSQYQYPEKGVDKEGNPTYDWNQNKAQYQGTRMDPRVFSPAVIVRYYWLVREKCQLYSALGGGLLILKPLRPFPNITPFGVRWGRGHWSGHAELTIGTTATALLIGAGYRF